MKRNLLAIAIPALLIAGAANASIEVWNKDGNKLAINGRVKAMNYMTKVANEVDKEGDHSDARLGFTGETQVTDSLTGYGRAEWEIKTGNSESVKTRYAFAGLNFGDIGSIDYGKNDGVTKAISAYTDVLPEFGGNASAEYYLLSERTEGVATYRNSNFFGLVDGLDFALQYADKADSVNGYDVTTEKFTTKSTRDAYGLNFDYAILDTGLSFAGAYAQTSGSDKYNTWGAGLKYDANDLYVAAIYVEAKAKNFNGSDESQKIRGFEVVAQYGIDFEVGRLTPSVAYIQHKARSVDDGDLVKYVDVGATYDFNKNLSAIIDYKINLLDKDDVGAKNKDANTKDTVAIGLIYQF